jgi:excisionase family DNA binding protein
MADLLTVEEVASMLRVHHSTVRRFIADGQLTALRLGGKVYRISRDDVERFLAESEVRADAPAAKTEAVA